MWWQAGDGHSVEELHRQLATVIVFARVRAEESVGLHARGLINGGQGMSWMQQAHSMTGRAAKQIAALWHTPGQGQFHRFDVDIINLEILGASRARLLKMSDCA